MLHPCSIGTKQLQLHYYSMSFQHSSSTALPHKASKLRTVYKVCEPLFEIGTVIRQADLKPRSATCHTLVPQLQSPKACRQAAVQMPRISPERNTDSMPHGLTFGYSRIEAGPIDFRFYRRKGWTRYPLRLLPCGDTERGLYFAVTMWLVTEVCDIDTFGRVHRE